MAVAPATVQRGGSLATSIPDVTTETKRRKPVAPWLHTALVLAIVIGFSIGGSSNQQAFIARHGRVLLYLITMAFQWAICLFVIYSASRRQVSLGELVGGRWSNVEDVLLDLAIAAGFWLAAILTLGLVGWALGLRQPVHLEEAKKMINMLGPHTGIEMALWVSLASTAGFCEEVIFRGLLQRQFAALTNSVVAGVVLQAAVFGASHGYQGGLRMILIGVFGAMFGALAAWRKSLRPGMFVHAGQDTMAGAAMFALSKFRGW